MRSPIANRAGPANLCPGATIVHVCTLELAGRALQRSAAPSRASYGQGGPSSARVAEIEITTSKIARRRGVTAALRRYLKDCLL